MKGTVMSLCALMIIGQWFVPLRTIVIQESVLRNGTLFRFKTEPIDPTDPFRGKYITLTFEASTYKGESPFEWTRGDDLFVALGSDADGYAIVQGLSAVAPENKDHYVKGRVGFVGDNGTVFIHYPFDRFYVEESLATEAERAYWEAQSDSSQIAYAEVYVSGEEVALSDVKINNESLLELVRRINEDNR